MKNSTTIGVIVGAIAIVTASILFEAALLGLILSWFNVSLTFWQNLAIVVLANMIFKNTGSSSK
jgi:hypothetical protein